ncbi:hypothetical protein BV22DRAFT_1034226 [Leucogyrophana mollusca]|uniref:Uncharacterized protein n=1 Tax=Leucogyrophana mollusca TaxID=85980 RepID=A0ACB8BJ33_9AGAM|nr:hypothetical protein BV22DRAFT_1034226 [Leucogyrophana mollusca]
MVAFELTLVCATALRLRMGHPQLAPAPTVVLSALMGPSVIRVSGFRGNGECSFFRKNEHSAQCDPCMFTT